MSNKWWTAQSVFILTKDAMEVSSSLASCTLGVKLRQIELTNHFLVVLFENKIKTSVSIQFSGYFPVLNADELNVAKSGDRLIVD